MDGYVAIAYTVSRKPLNVNEDLMTETETWVLIGLKAYSLKPDHGAEVTEKESMEINGRMNLSTWVQFPNLKVLRLDFDTGPED